MFARHLFSIGHRDERLYRRELRREFLDERQKADVEEQVFVVGVINDVRELFGK